MAATSSVVRLFPGELWGLTTFFDPMGYANKLANLWDFATRVREQGLKLLTVELAFGDAPFTLPQAIADRVVRRRASAVMWHKERLLNIGLAELPDTCDKVVWLDGDILFENDGWVNEVAKRLETAPVVQPFATARWMPEGVRTIAEARERCGRGEFVGAAMPSLACARAGFREPLSEDARQLGELGHPGFAWAARRDVFGDIGFYDRLIVGGADSAMAMAMEGDADTLRGRSWFQLWMPPALRRDLASWSRQLASRVGGAIDWVDGDVWHLWHGDREHRAYVDRFQILKRAEFDPLADLALDDNGCWRWGSAKPTMHEDVRQYFRSRQEERT